MSEQETWVKWEKCGPFEDSGRWTVEELTPTGRIIAECCEEWRADAIIADHNDAALLREKLARWESAMTDVSVVNWTLSEENAEDLHLQLMAVIAQTVQEAIDPVVSEQAALLRVALEALEWIAKHESWPSWKLARYAESILTARPELRGEK